MLGKFKLSGDKRNKKLKIYEKFFYGEKSWRELFGPGKLIDKIIVGKYMSHLNKFWSANFGQVKKKNFYSVIGLFQ